MNFNILLLTSILLLSNFHAGKNELVVSEEFIKIYDQSLGENKKWYINDHCFIRDQNGKWHMFGITHEEPAKPSDENNFAHATANSIIQAPWEKLSFALSIAPEAPWFEHQLWAPYVIFHAGKYFMYYCAGGECGTEYRINLTTSEDLINWTRNPENPMVTDGWHARDPFVFEMGNKWIMYYTATRPADKGNHVVMAISSDDLIHWTNKQVVFTHPDIGTSGGPTESPFVVKHKGKYFLFVCTNKPYDNTAVYKSDSPFYWDTKNQVGSIPAHCAEVIQDSNKWYISRAGWGRGGLYLAKLIWKD